MHTVGPGICRENWKTLKIVNGHFKNWNMQRKLKIMENEKHTLQGLEYGEKHRKT